MDPERVAQMRRDVAYGYALGWVAEKWGVCPQALSRWMKDVERPTQRTTGYEKLLDLEESVLRDYLEEGVGMRELKVRFGVHEGTMRSFLQAKGVLKGRGAQSGVHNPQSKGRAVTERDRDSGKYWARRVVEQALGRQLPKGWVIHHMNECPTDQTLTNLWLFPGMAEHSMYHQRQRDNLTRGAQLSASHLASDSGGLWLPRILVLPEFERDTVLRSPSDTQE